MTSTEAVLWGCLGGVLPDVLRLVGVRYGPPPEYLKQGFFWISLFLLVGVAALTTFLLSPSRIIDAIALGFSAPEILSTALASKKPRNVIIRSRKKIIIRSKTAAPDLHSLNAYRTVANDLLTGKDSEELREVLEDLERAIESKQRTLEEEQKKQKDSDKPSERLEYKHIAKAENEPSLLEDVRAWWGSQI